MTALEELIDAAKKYHVAKRAAVANSHKSGYAAALAREALYAELCDAEVALLAAADDYAGHR